MELGKRSKDLTGQTFGSLTAIKPTKQVRTSYYWQFLCRCGNLHEARGNTVTYIAKKGDKLLPSCGCEELKRKTKHGYRKATNTHPTYRTYRGMLDRCYNPKSTSYQWYGALGVTVCEEWLENPKAFIEWSLENGWEKYLHIDKDILCKEKGINPPIYSPDTCKWVTAKKNVGFATNRTNYGSHPNVRLSQSEVDEILERYNQEDISQSELGRQYGVTSSSISRLVRLQGRE